MKNAAPNIDASRHYFNPRLKQALAAIHNRPMTVIEAPMGYGKTLSVREYLRETGMKTVWTTAFHAGPDIFWRDFCLNLERGLPGQEKTVAALARLGYPHDAVQTGEAYHQFLDLDFVDDTALVVDDFHLIPVPAAAPAGIGGLFELLAGQGEDAPRLILISRNRYAGNREMLFLKNRLAIIGRDELALDEKDIREYYRLCGAVLAEEDSRRLFARTSGWVSALYLHLLRYGRHGVSGDPEPLERLVEKEVLDSMPGEALDLLLATYPLERFSRAQTEAVHRGGNAPALLRELMSVNSFLTCDEADGAFMLHAVVRDRLGERFLALPAERRRAIHAACGDCAMADGDVMGALRFFHAAREYEKALDALESGHGRRLVTKDTGLLTEIIAACPPELLEKHLDAEFIYTLNAFIAGKMELFGERVARLAERCAALPDDDPETGARRGDLEFLLSLAAYNDIAAMSRHHRRANAFRRGASTQLFPHQSPWTLGSPSVLFMFHRAAGELDRELELMRECMPHYYTLAGGHGFGGERQMEAEALFLRGEFSAAAAAERQAEAFSLSKEQFGNALAALFVRMRLSLMDGDYPAARSLVEDMQNRIRERNEYYYLHTVDLCEGHLLATLGKTGGVAEWLRQGMGGEERLYAFAGGYYYIVHGGVLLAEDRWDEAVGLYSWLLEAGMFAHNLLLPIHAHLYLAAAHQATGRTDAATTALWNAAALAFPDGIVMPFVENWRYLAGIPVDAADTAAPFARVRDLAAKWERRRRGILSRHFPADAPRLTKRELELARLAATGMKYREIADRAYITHGTAKRAFATMYGKLGISSREELQAYLRKHDS